MYAERFPFSIYNSKFMLCLGECIKYIVRTVLPHLYIPHDTNSTCNCAILRRTCDRQPCK